MIRIKVKLTMEQLLSIISAYETCTKIMQHESETEHYTLHETLLLEHAKTLLIKLKKLSGKGQLKYTLNLSSVSAVAIHQLWQRAFGISANDADGIRVLYQQIDSTFTDAIL